MPLTLEQQRLVENEIPYVVNLTNKFAQKRPDLAEQLLSEAFLALVECATRYNPSMKCEFRTYATYRMRGCLFDFFSNVPKYETNVPSYLLERTNKKSEEDNFEELIRDLNPPIRELLRWKYMDDLSVEEISIKINMPYSTVCSTLHRAYKLLRAG